MKKTEIILISLAIIALIMRLFDIPSHGALWVLSLSILSIIYFNFGFALFNNLRLRNILKKESYIGISQGRIIGAIGTGLALSLSSIGILFRFQSYPGSKPMLMIGLFGMAIVTITAVIKNRGTTDNFYTNILKRIAIYVPMVIFLLALPTKTWMNWKYPDNPEYVQAVLDAQENPESLELWDKAENEREKMLEERDKEIEE